MSRTTVQDASVSPRASGSDERPASRFEGARNFLRAHVMVPAKRHLDHARRMRRERLGPPEPGVPKRALFPVPGAPLGGWTFHDERWARIAHRWEHRRLLRQGRALVVDDERQEPSAGVVCSEDGSIAVDIQADGGERWVWLHLDPGRNLWRNFRWEFTARRDSRFRELQFGFRYNDFYNRYRFRHEADSLHFDIVANGRFRNGIHRKPFRMEPGRDHRYAIEARDDRFILTVDGSVVLDEVDGRQRFPRGSIAIVLWENDGRTPIRATITDIRAWEL